MQAHTTTALTRRRRWREWVLDLFSPSLICDACGETAKQFRCERTGEVRTVPEDAQPSRWTAMEVEYRCPGCGASIWVLDVPMQYPFG